MAVVCCPRCSSENVMFSRAVHICEDCQHGCVPAESVTPRRIFLSYGHDANECLVRRIKADLEKRGHDVWFDKSQIKFGNDWRRAITDGISESHRVLSFLSKYSTRDPGVCLDEIAIAIGVKGGNIQTVLAESETEVKPSPPIRRSRSDRTAAGSRRPTRPASSKRHNDVPAPARLAPCCDEKASIPRPRSNFIVLLGQRYGWCPLSPQITAAADCALLERWYATLRRTDSEHGGEAQPVMHAASLDTLNWAACVMAKRFPTRLGTGGNLP